jgi:hypothetical protein
MCILQDERNESEEGDVQLTTFSDRTRYPDDSSVLVRHESALTELVAHGHDKPCR